MIEPRTQIIQVYAAASRPVGTQIAFNLPLMAATDIIVHAGSNSDTQLEYGTDYTVQLETGADDFKSGGVLVLLTAQTAKLTLTRSTRAYQDVSLALNSRIPGPSLERQLDRYALVEQELVYNLSIMQQSISVINTSLASHTGNSDIHVTASDKTTWNGKASAADLSAHTGNGDIHVTVSDKTTWNNAVQALFDMVAHYDTMPAAATVTDGMVAIYDGETSASYTQGHIYKAISGSASTPSLTARPYVMTFEQLVSSPASFADTGEVCNGHPVYKIENWAKTHDDSTFIHVWLWNSKAQDDNIDYWVVYAGGVSQVAETFTKSGKDGWCTTIDGTYTALGIGIIDSDGGLVVTAGSSAEPSWHDITPSGSGGSASWGGITGTLSSQTDLANALAAKISSAEKGTANGVATLNNNGVIPSSMLPKATTNILGAVCVDSYYGISFGTGGSSNSIVPLYASNAQIDSRTARKILQSSSAEYLVRSVQPLITSLPSDAASPIALSTASATSNNHSFVYQHTPDSAPIYKLPNITKTTITHDIVIFLDLSSVATFSFQDSSGTTVAVDTNGVTPAIGEKWTFWAEYVHNTWIVRGMRDMEASA